MTIAIAYFLTALILCAAWITIGGLINLAFRKPFLSQWKRDVSLGITMVAGDLLYSFIPIPARVPAAIASGVALLIVFVWLCAKPGNVIEASKNRDS